MIITPWSNSSDLSTVLLFEFVSEILQNLHVPDSDSKFDFMNCVRRPMRSTFSVEMAEDRGIPDADAAIMVRSG